MTVWICQKTQMSATLSGMAHMASADEGCSLCGRAEGAVCLAGEMLAVKVADAVLHEYQQSAFAQKWLAEAQAGWNIVGFDAKNNDICWVDVLRVGKCGNGELVLSVLLVAEDALPIDEIGSFGIVVKKRESDISSGKPA